MHLASDIAKYDLIRCCSTLHLQDHVNTWHNTVLFAQSQIKELQLRMVKVDFRAWIYRVSDQIGPSCHLPRNEVYHSHPKATHRRKVLYPAKHIPTAIENIVNGRMMFPDKKLLSLDKSGICKDTAQLGPIHNIVEDIQQALSMSCMKFAEGSINIADDKLLESVCV